ncbi:MAG: VanZ family protein [Acidimicrobiales bacterium]
MVTPRIGVRGGFDFDRVEDLAHAGAGALVVVTLALLLPQPATRRSLGLASMLTIAAATIAEVVQLAAPGRSPASADLAYDLAGVLIGVVTIVVARARVPWRSLRRSVALLLTIVGVGTLVLVHPV